MKCCCKGVKWVSLIPSLANNVSRFAKFPAKIPEERFPRLFLLRSLKDGAKQRIISALSTNKKVRPGPMFDQLAAVMDVI